MASPFDLIVIGGGAAGFFGAINAKHHNPSLQILILEKSTKVLAKVKVSGGGRCNVTNHCFEPTPLSKHYPRGQKELKNIFRSFDAKSTVQWFAQLGVSLKAEDDGRMFPTTNHSQTIIDCFLAEAHRYHIEIEVNSGVDRVEKNGNLFFVRTAQRTFQSTFVLVAIGGHPQKSAYTWIEKLNHTISPLIPSLFTFNDTEKKFTDLMGVSVSNAEVKIAGTKFSERGAVLITHWGLSGPAVIKLSAWAAEYLHEKNYTFVVLVNWAGSMAEHELRALFLTHKVERGKQKISSHPFFGLSQRLWEKLISLAEINNTKTWAEISGKEMNRLIEFLIRCPFQIKGKTTFKEEFVTCGGVPLNEIDLTTMQSKKVSGLFFAGEVLHIDGETGGFNFQAAWSTAFVAAHFIGATHV